MSCDILERLHELRVDLVDLAFSLECRGQIEAADVAIATSARLRELCDESTERLKFQRARPGVLNHR